VDNALRGFLVTLTANRGTPIPVYDQNMGRERGGAMRKETQGSSDRDRLDLEVAAADALELARRMAPGPERNEALKVASALRCSADERGLVFAKRGRPRK